MPEPRVIKKYPNRRLYDTQRSRYIKLADVRKLVLDEVPVAVLDQPSGRDITCSILLQVISESEREFEPIMSRNFLVQIIRAYGRVAAGPAADYLEQCLDAYLGRHAGEPVGTASVAPVCSRVRSIKDDAQRRAAASGEHHLPDTEDAPVQGARKKAG